jgi:hypothetical protein
LYLEFSQTESSKAEESKILTPGMLPVEMNIDEAVIAPADTNIRDGAQYKIARPLSETPAFDE